jgi:hypothetical protein
LRLGRSFALASRRARLRRRASTFAASFVTVRQLRVVETTPSRASSQASLNLLRATPLGRLR